MKINASLVNGSPFAKAGKAGAGMWAQRGQHAGAYGGQACRQGCGNAEQGGCAAKRMLSRNESNTDATLAGAGFSRSIAESSASYGESIRNARMKARETSLQLKKLRYNFKAISAQILRSKTSASARQAVGKARREVIRLKRQQGSGAYDDEELKGAIAHAQAMERVAKKKMRHLLEEEMRKATGGLCAGDLEEQERTEDEAVEGESLEGGAMADTAMADTGMAASVEDLTSEFMTEMSESMRDLLEELGLSDLAECMFSAEAEVDPADFELMKKKHRSEELKDIVKADAEYLKALFERLEGANAVPAAASGVFDVSV